MTFILVILTSRAPCELLSLLKNIEEYIKCKEDPVYFERTTSRSSHLMDHGLQPFKMYDFQERLVRNFHEKGLISVRCHDRLVSLPPWYLFLRAIISSMIVLISVSWQNKSINWQENFSVGYRLHLRELTKVDATGYSCGTKDHWS